MVARKTYLIFGICMLLNFSFYLSFAGVLESDLRKSVDSCVSISGKIDRESDPIDSIVINFKVDYMFNTLDKYTTVKTAYPDKTGLFNFKFCVKDGIGKISQIVIYSGSDVALLQQYLVEAGDDIFMNVAKKDDHLKIYFSGSGAIKYSCRREIELEYSRIYNQYVNLYSGDIVSNLSRIDSLYFEWDKKLLNVLSPYKTEITPIASSVLKADAICQRPMNKESLFRVAFSDAGSVFEKRKIAMYYLSNLKNDELFDDRTYSLSYNFVDFLLQKIQTALFFSEGGQTYSIIKAFAEIANTYNGELRDRLLMQLLVNPRFKKAEMAETTKDYESSLHEANKIVSNKLVKREIINKIESVSNGAVARDFALEDRDGKLVTLKDFKGKVVLLDVWYTGCLPCMVFSQRMERDIYPLFYGNRAFKVVSISIDKNKNSWLKSVDGGHYTNKNNINLFTGGAGSNHPFIKGYEVRGLPFLLLIDKNGHIFTRLTNVMSSKEISMLIKEAILAN